MKRGIPGSMVWNLIVNSFSMRFLFLIYFRLTLPNLHIISQEAVERVGVKGLTNVIGNNK